MLDSKGIIDNKNIKDDYVKYKINSIYKGSL